jgi:hypothetical protein
LKKIIHVHSDPKFLKASLKRFKTKEFDNCLVFLGDEKISNLDFNDSICLIPNKLSLKKVIKYCDNSDLVIFYNLDVFKSRVVNRLSRDLKIGWYFFGLELYGRKLDIYLSEFTKEFIRSNRTWLDVKVNTFLTTLKEYLRAIKWGSFAEKEFQKAMKRIDYFFGLYQEEYNHLEEQWPILPKFIRRPVRKPEEYNSGYLNEKENTIIVGNNRSVYNNHLDVFKIMEDIGLGNEVNLKLLFSYGQDNAYADKVRKYANDISSVELIEKFLSTTDFLNLYSSSGALVINGYRQMAMGNIGQALGSGLKIYLNKKNTVYEYLINKNFEVFSIEDFRKDVRNGNVILDRNARIHNYEMLRELYSERTIQDFQRELFKLI